jgi:hypothetical protein
MTGNSEDLPYRTFARWQHELDVIGQAFFPFVRKIQGNYTPSYFPKLATAFSHFLKGTDLFV